MEKMRIKKITVIIFAIVICLFALLLIQCRKYALQNQELQAENEELSAMLDSRANKDKTIEVGVEYMEQPSAQQQAETDRLQAQPAEAVSMEEYRIETDFVVNDDGECAELESDLAAFPDCSVRVVMYAWDSDARETADALRERWERNCGQDGYSVSMSFYPIYGEKTDEDTYLQNILTPFYTLAGNDYKEIIEEALKQEEGYLRFVRLERIGESVCCSFEIGEWEESYHREGDGYHIILEGQWEGKELSLQHLYIPYTKMEQRSVGTYEGYMTENVDINFDGKQDLLIHEGSSGGSGGSWKNYRAIVWNEKKGQFEYYSSFPEQLTSLEFDRQRVVFRGNGGTSYEHVEVYSVVDGEYICTRELVTESRYSEGKQDPVDVLSYYEMGELVQTHILSDLDERERLYPDMNYWR